jgi:hypothetical protein
LASFLLPVPPEGLGTTDIEALDSYIQRLAIAHGVTMHTLCRVLRDWWLDVKKPEEPELSRYLGQTQKCGCGHDIDWLVRALELSTGFTGLSSMTLRAFTYVSGPHVGNILRHVHYWCPGCMKEWFDSGVIPYEKLLWRLNPITRCHLHKLQLTNNCPHCGSKQVRGADRPWFECSDCTRLLFDDQQHWIYEPKPSQGEKDLIDIVSYSATNPDKVFAKDAPEKFFRFVKERHTDGRFSDVVGDYFHSRESSSRILLTSLLRVAEYFDTPLIDILTKSAFSASSIQLEDASIRPVGPHPSQCTRPIEIREKLRQEVETSLSQGLEGKCMAKICHELNICPNTANRWCPDLVPLLAKHHKRLRAERKTRQIARLRALSYRDLIAELDSIGWHKLPHAIARRTGVPIHLVRERITELRHVSRKMPKV